MKKTNWFVPVQDSMYQCKKYWIFLLNIDQNKLNQFKIILNLNYIYNSVNSKVYFKIIELNTNIYSLFSSVHKFIVSLFQIYIINCLLSPTMKIETKSYTFHKFQLLIHFEHSDFYPLFFYMHGGFFWKGFSFGLEHPSKYRT